MEIVKLKLIAMLVIMLAIMHANTNNAQHPDHQNYQSIMDSTSTSTRTYLWPTRYSNNNDDGVVRSAELDKLSPRCNNDSGECISTISTKMYNEIVETSRDDVVTEEIVDVINQRRRRRRRLDEDEEEEEGKDYISYAALSKDNIPCNRRGQSYYSNCTVPTQVNPYTRACTAVTQCARL